MVLLGLVILFWFVEHRLVVGPALRLNKTAYALSHVSIVAFVLDLPGLAVREMSWAHFLIVSINTTTTAAAVIWYYISLDYARAWGCYPSHTHYDDLTGGTCDNPDSLRPPKVCQYGMPTTPNCVYYREPPAPTFALRAPLWHFAVHAFIFTLAVYFGGIPEKIRWIVKRS